MIFAICIFIGLPMAFVLILSFLEMIACNHGFLRVKECASKVKTFDFIKINLACAIIFCLIFYLIGILFLPVWVIISLFLICIIYQLFEKRALSNFFEKCDTFFVPFVCKMITAIILIIILFCVESLIAIIH